MKKRKGMRMVMRSRSRRKVGWGVMMTMTMMMMMTTMMMITMTMTMMMMEMSPASRHELVMLFEAPQPWHRSTNVSLFGSVSDGSTAPIFLARMQKMLGSPV